MVEQNPGISVDAYLRFMHDDGPNDGPTEFSFGPGLIPRGKEHAAPDKGGMYRGTSPRAGRPSPRDRDAPGDPGTRVAR